MKITKKWLEKKRACESGIKYVTEQKLIGLQGKDFVKKLIKLDKLDYANWLVVRLMTHKQQIRYAIYAAEQVIKIYEDKYPDDKRPRDAINAAKKYLNKPTKENKDAAADATAYAANAAYAAAYATAYATADAAANAAYAAAYATANAAYAAAYATANAAYAAAYATAYAANAAMKTKILKYGLRLIWTIS